MANKKINKFERLELLKCPDNLIQVMATFCLDDTNKKMALSIDDLPRRGGFEKRIHYMPDCKVYEMQQKLNKHKLQ